MWFKNNMSIAQQPMPINNTLVHKNKSTVALDVANIRAISYRHQHAKRAVKWVSELFIVMKLVKDFSI